MIKTNVHNALTPYSAIPSNKTMGVIAVLLLLLAGTLTMSSVIESSGITQIEIRNPIVRTPDGTYFGLIGR